MSTQCVSESRDHPVTQYLTVSHSLQEHSNAFAHGVVVLGGQFVSLFSNSGPPSCLPMNSSTAPRRHGMITRPPEDASFGGLGPDPPCCPPPSHGSSRLKSITEELGVTEIPTCRCASLFKVKHCGIQFPCGLCGAAHTQILCHRGASSGSRPRKRITLIRKTQTWKVLDPHPQKVSECIIFSLTCLRHSKQLRTISSVRILNPTRSSEFTSGPDIIYDVSSTMDTSAFPMTEPCRSCFDSGAHGQTTRNWRRSADVGFRRLSC